MSGMSEAGTGHESWGLTGHLTYTDFLTSHLRGCNLQSHLLSVVVWLGLGVPCTYVELSYPQSRLTRLGTTNALL